MKELTFELSIRMPDGEVKPFDSLSDDELEKIKHNWSERLSKNMSNYYTQHPEQFERL